MIYVTGDMHGEMRRFHSRALRRLKKGDTLVICGDFGFLWDGGEQEEKNLRRIGRLKYQVLFLDGTHENFDLLEKYPAEDWNGGRVQHISGGLYHLMRGQVYTIEGKKIFAFGGGESVEKQIRMEMKTWWPCEMPNLEEMKEGADHLRENGFEVDYIFTHMPPPKVDLMKTERRNQLEAYFGEMMKQTKYKKWFFGSQHIDRKITYKNYAVFSGVVPVEEAAGPKHFFGR